MSNNVTEVVKPWGITRCLHRDVFSEVHHASIKAGGYSSRHHHARKANLFYVMAGVLVVHQYDPDQKPVTLTAGQRFTVASKLDHRFEALSDVELIEVYWSDALDPDDIVRVDVGGLKPPKGEPCHPRP